MVDEDSPDSHSADLSISGEEGHWTILLAYYISWFELRTKLFSNAGYTAKLHKNLRNLIFVAQFAYISTRPKKGFVFPSKFWAAFVIKSIFEFFF